MADMLILTRVEPKVIGWLVVYVRDSTELIMGLTVLVTRWLLADCSLSVNSSLPLA